MVTNAGWPEGLEPGQTHWFLRHRASGMVVDPTADQFSIPVDYQSGRGCGFLTAAPSRRAAILMERAAALVGQRENAELAKSVDAAGLNPAQFRVQVPDSAPSLEP